MHRNLISFFLGLMVLTAFHQAMADIDSHCLVKPADLGKVATRILHSGQKTDGRFPSIAVIQSDFSGQFSNEVSNINATYEAFARIEKSDNISALPIPLGNVELNYERDIVYVCAHFEPDSQHSFLEIYFLTGYNLGKTTMKSFIGDVLFDSVKVAPVTISPVGFDMMGNIFETNNKIISSILTAPFRIASQAQRIAMTAIKTIFPAGVERIIVTDKEVLFSDGVNLKDPKKATVDYTVDLTAKTAATADK